MGERLAADAVNAMRAFLWSPASLPKETSETKKKNAADAGIGEHTVSRIP